MPKKRASDQGYRFVNSMDVTSRRKGPKRASPKPPAPVEGTPEYHIDRALEHLEKAHEMLEPRKDAAA